MRDRIWRLAGAASALAWTRPVQSWHCRAAAAALIIALFMGCAPKAKPELTPEAVRLWQANQAASALGTLQRTAIRFHAEQRLSEKNTRAVVSVVTPALEQMKAQPLAWKPISTKALNDVDKGLDAEGHRGFDAYVQQARDTINGL